MIHENADKATLDKIVPQVAKHLKRQYKDTVFMFNYLGYSIQYLKP